MLFDPLMPQFTRLGQRHFTFMGITQGGFKRKDLHLALKTPSQRSKKMPDFVLPCKVLAHRQQLGRLLRPHQQHTQSIAVGEFERGVAWRNLRPQLVHAKVVPVNGCVMKQHNAPGGHLGQPCLEVVPHCLVGMQAVNVQQIHAAIGKAWQRIVECHAQKRGELRIVRVMGFLQTFIDAVVIHASVSISFPCIHGERTRGQLVVPYGLAERQIRDTRVRAQLDKGLRLQHWDQPERKRYMPRPGSRGAEMAGLHEGSRIHEIHLKVLCECWLNKLCRFQ